MSAAFVGVRRDAGRRAMSCLMLLSLSLSLSLSLWRLQ
jgi:hypothetical protein